MSTPNPSDEDLDRLLASKLKRTSVDFELRWRDLRGHLIPPPASRARLRLPRWLLWPGLATASLALFAFVLILRDPPRPSAMLDAESFGELFELNASLMPAAPLLDGEIRDAVLHLPVQSEP